MIDPKVFAELQNRQVITNVGLEPADFKDIDDVINRGYATSLSSEEVYDDIVSDLSSFVTTVDELITAIANGGMFTLGADIVLSDYLNVKSDVTINLNGYSITHPASSTSKYKDVFEVMTGGKLTIDGEGNIVAENGYAVYAAGNSVVTLNGGCYFSPVSAVDARKDATVTINGGEFKVDGSNNPDGDFGQKFTLNLRDKKGNYVTDSSDIVVKGGRFYKYNPAASESEPEITNFVAEGYVSIPDGDWFVVKEA
jgi:hypothetical protein